MTNWNGIFARLARAGSVALLLSTGLVNQLVEAQSPDEVQTPLGLPESKDAKVLNPAERIWIDKKNRRLIFDGEICLQRGPLELLICPWNGKLHESVIRVHAKPSTIHAGLLALGSQPGAPVSYQDEYKPASGDVVDVIVRWLDEAGNWQEAHGQDWVRHRDRRADSNNPDHAELIQRAKQSPADQSIHQDEVESFWVPVHPAFTKRVKQEKKSVTRPSEAGKQLEQLMILTDPRALDVNRPAPEEYYRAQFSPAKRNDAEHKVWIDKAVADEQRDELYKDGRLRARWESVFPDRKDIIASDKNNVLRPSPAGRQIEELIIRGRSLDHDWVFAGSHIASHPETGEEFYVADRSGELVCVSNFPSALIDLPIESSSDNASLGFQADEASIPQKGTPVRVFLVPAKSKKGQADSPEQ